MMAHCKLQQIQLLFPAFHRSQPSLNRTRSVRTCWARVGGRCISISISRGRTELSSQAWPLTPPLTPTRASLMGMDNKLAREHGAYTGIGHTQNKKNKKHLPHTSLSTRLLLPRSLEEVFLFLSCFSSPLSCPALSPRCRALWEKTQKKDEIKNYWQTIDEAY